MANEGSQSDLDSALAQMDSAPPPPPPSADGMGQDPVTPQQPANPELWQENDGSRRLPELSVHAAAKELSFARRQRGEEADGTKPRPITEVRYQREPEGELTADQASKDLSAYRRETAERLLQELGVEQSAPRPEAVPEPALEQPTFSPEQLEQAAQRQQAEQHTAAAWQASGDYQNLLQAGITQMLGHAAGEFADIKTVQDVERLAASDPARFAKWGQLDSQVRQVQQELANIRTQQAQAYTAAYQQFAVQHDKAVEAMVPELAPGADPRAKALFQQTAADLLKEVGYSDHELRHAWQNGGVFMLRDARAQKIVADAARWRISQAKAKEALKAPHPEVQRPGVRMPQSSYGDQMIQSHSKALSSSGNLRDAVALRRAQYAQRRSG
jgi:hypothetical protein